MTREEFIKVETAKSCIEHAIGDIRDAIENCRSVDDEIIPDMVNRLIQLQTNLGIAKEWLRILENEPISNTAEE